MLFSSFFQAISEEFRGGLIDVAVEWSYIREHYEKDLIHYALEFGN